MKKEGNTSSFRIRETALKALVKVEKDSSYLNLVLPSYLKSLPPVHRGTAAAISYGTVQRLNTLDWALSCYLKKPLKGMTPWIRNLLRSAAYQLLYMDNVPSPLVVDMSVNLAYRYGHKGVASLVNAVLRKLSPGEEVLPFPERNSNPVEYISLYHSHPQWLVNRWVERMGIDKTEEMCRANNQVPPVSLRVNTLKTSREEVKKQLVSEGVKVESEGNLPVSLKVRPNAPIGELTGFRQGLYTVQGESSMHCGFLLHPSPGEEVVDLCSAPGGKATHLAEIMNNTGVVYAGDVNYSRLGLVEKAANRLGLDIIQTRLWDGREVHQHVKPVDAVLCDAPCTGLGVISLKPDLKWHKSEEDLHSLPGLQGELLASSAGVVKPGGRLLYAVCSLEPEETFHVVEKFLRENPDFYPVDLTKNESNSIWGDNLRADTAVPGTAVFYPYLHGMEGFFAALFYRKK